MRLIDADRLKDSIMLTCDLGGWIGETLLQIKKVAVKYIENAPTIDAEPVVRCSECKYVGHDATTFLVCDRKGMGLKPFHVYHDDYCSYGERREDGEV